MTVGGAEAIYCLNKAAGGVKQSENVLRYIAAASPETMLALLNEIAELEQRHCGTALLEREEMHAKTLGRMLDELDAKDKLIAELEAREVVLPQRYSMLHRVDFDEPYHTEMVYKQHQVLEALHDAGVNVAAAAGKGEAS
ncbi:hypothetical protein SS48_20125 [Enterobacter hormaechei subsp. xiangfangensis]|nr:hypothetical protein SS48_20125 [Enterobacter hormaechei subsp. xiangfangensis]